MSTNHRRSRSGSTYSLESVRSIDSVQSIDTVQSLDSVKSFDSARSSDRANSIGNVDLPVQLAGPDNATVSIDGDPPPPCGRVLEDRGSTAISPTRIASRASAPHTMPSTQPTLKKHPRFYLDPRTVELLLDDGTLYRVFRYSLETHSSAFAAQYIAHGTGEGPIRLPGVSSVDLDRFLSLIYPDEIATPTLTTAAGWTSVLRLAHKWSFLVLRQRAIREVYALGSVVDRIAVAREFGDLDCNGCDGLTELQTWLLPAFVEACTTECWLDSVSEEDAERLGAGTVLKIARIREANRKASPKDLAYDVESAIVDAGLAPAPSASDVLPLVPSPFRTSIRTPPVGAPLPPDGAPLPPVGTPLPPVRTSTPLVGWPLPPIRSTPVPPVGTPITLDDQHASTLPSSVSQGYMPVATHVASTEAAHVASTEATHVASTEAAHVASTEAAYVASTEAVEQRSIGPAEQRAIGTAEQRAIGTAEKTTPGSRTRDEGKMQVLDRGVAKAHDNGIAKAHENGNAEAHDDGIAKAPDDGIAKAPDDGIAKAPDDAEKVVPINPRTRAINDARQALLTGVWGEALESEINDAAKQLEDLGAKQLEDVRATQLEDARATQLAETRSAALVDAQAQARDDASPTIYEDAGTTPVGDANVKAPTVANSQTSHRVVAKGKGPVVVEAKVPVVAEAKGPDVADVKTLKVKGPNTKIMRNKLKKERERLAREAREEEKAREAREQAKAMEEAEQAKEREEAERRAWEYLLQIS